MADDPARTAAPAPDQAADPAPYQALYRRYRPQRFADVLGQEHVTRALRHAVRDHKVAHAYLFSGPRGTGKTSTARILAMALNCEHPVDGEPDGTCPSCVAIRQGTSLDVQELDSATNRGIDEMRDLLGRVALGTPGRWKVYIIDEVHQMTSAAASALLKTLEDPPGHVIFVLATTDPQKVLPTIRSRTQHFEFHLLGAECWPRCSGRSTIGPPSASPPKPSTWSCAGVMGRPGMPSPPSTRWRPPAPSTTRPPSSRTSSRPSPTAIPGRVLLEVAEAISAGRDPRRLGTDLLEQLRDGFLATQARSLVLLADDAVAAVEAQARRLGTPALVRAMEVIGQALIDMRDAPDPRITLEVALVRLAAVEADDSRSALLVRIERLERLVGEREEGVRGAHPFGPLDPAAPGPGASCAGRVATSRAVRGQPVGARRSPPAAAAPGLPGGGSFRCRPARRPDAPAAVAPSGVTGRAGGVRIRPRARPRCRSRLRCPPGRS